MNNAISFKAIKKAKLIEKMVDYYTTIGVSNPIVQAVLIVEWKLGNDYER